MTNLQAHKYGEALTGSDWPGLPLRVGHLPGSGVVTDLSSDVDSVLVWSGGPSNVSIEYEMVRGAAPRRHEFRRRPSMIDLLPRTARLREVKWEGKPSMCIGVNLPGSSLKALGTELHAGLSPDRGPQFGLTDAHLVDLVHRLHQQAEGQNYWGAVYVQSLSLALASYVNARYGGGPLEEESQQGPALSSTKKHRVVAFVEAHLDENFGLLDLAKAVGYSPDHFSRLFKRSFNQSPHQYVLDRRIERAKALLQDESLPISEVALSCGFANQGHLTTAFRTRTGLTPAKFRRS